MSQPVNVKMETIFSNGRKMLPNNVKPRIAFTGTKVGTSYQIKDKTEMKHNNDIVCYNECPEEQCNENYIGETGRRISDQ